MCDISPWKSAADFGAGLEHHSDSIKADVPRPFLSRASSWQAIWFNFFPLS